MAADAGGRRTGVLAADVAGGALDVGVLAGQWELGAVMVEVRGLPGIHRVAGIASSGEAGGRVIRIRGLLEIRQVAANTGGGCPRILTADMAGGTLN